MATRTCPLAFFVVAAVLAAGCGSKDNAGAATSEAPAVATQAGATLSPEQVKNGIGPVSQLELPATIDEKLAKEGEETFTTKCSACHRFDQRYVGPALGQVLERRTPAYVMNMILNPTEMTQKHPIAHELLATHMTQMPALGLTEAQARAVLEYLRKSAKPEAGAKS